MLSLFTLISILFIHIWTSFSSTNIPKAIMSCNTESFSAMALLAAFMDTLRTLVVRTIPNHVTATDAKVSVSDGEGSTIVSPVTQSVVTATTSTPRSAIKLPLVKTPPINKSSCVPRKAAAKRHAGPQILTAPTGGYNCTVM